MTSSGRFELSKSFRFEAAHQLGGTMLGESSQTIHGHSFRAVVVAQGQLDHTTGMVVDLGLLTAHITEVQSSLDHRLLNAILDLGAPTLENLLRYIYDRLSAFLDIARVEVRRDSCGEACTYRPDR